MTITFATIIFAFVFLFKAIQKNVTFILYAVTMILAAYYCENFLGWKVKLFGKAAILLFILFHIIILNLYTFLAYGKDKLAAKRGSWRIPEIQLHTLELLGGTIGAFLGQKIFHHKNKKKSFMAVFFFNVFVQIVLIVYILNTFKFW